MGWWEYPAVAWFLHKKGTHFRKNREEIGRIRVRSNAYANEGKDKATKGKYKKIKDTNDLSGRNQKTLKDLWAMRDLQLI